MNAEEKARFSDPQHWKNISDSVKEVERVNPQTGTRTVDVGEFIDAMEKREKKGSK